jgi:ABC-type glycerol-3-phosphate transport system permease component
MENVFVGSTYVFMGLFALIIFLPLLYIIQLTFSVDSDTSFRIIPRGFTLKHYAYVISAGMILRPLVNSVYLTVACTVAALVLTLLLAYFSSIPDSLVESARMDGCPEVLILARIMVPVALPAIATIALFYMMGAWNKYFDIILYINDASKHTLQVILRTLVLEEEALHTTTRDAARFKENIQYTTIVVAIIPVMIVYPLLQKQFVKGIMLGSVKG